MLGVIKPKAGERVWEIGPGVGSITHALVERVRELTVFEIDRGFARYLDAAFGGRPGFRVVTGDFVDTWKAVYAESGPPDTMFGNLPYRSAARILASLIEGGGARSRLVVTVQREVARRISARPGSKDYSSFSILCQSAFAAAIRGDLKPGSFYPVPRVVSTIVELVPHDAFKVSDPALFHELTRLLFAARRKTVRNNALSSARLRSLDRDLLVRLIEASGIDPEERAERLEIGQIVDLANRILAQEL